MTSEERLEKLERELVRVKLGNRRIALAGAGLLLGLFALLVSGRSMTSTVYGQEESAGKKEVIRANEFVLEDDQGQPRALLNMTKDGPKLAMRDEKGQPRVILDTYKIGSSLILYDENGKPRIILNAYKDGSKLALYDENGKPRAEFRTSQTRTQDGKVITYPESSLRLFSPDGKLIWQAP